MPCISVTLAIRWLDILISRAWNSLGSHSGMTSIQGVFKPEKEVSELKCIKKTTVLPAKSVSDLMFCLPSYQDL